ncbi:MAG: hypothetical protein L0154_17145 [Chloroflexi bacterium]|nr:hypothetical protein [Chloroflexota bacterium]
MHRLRSKKYRPCGILYLLISVICLLPVSACGLLYTSNRDETPTEINWNVSTGNTIDLVNWPKNHPTSVYHIEYPIVNLKISDEYEITGYRPRHIYVITQDNQTIYEISMTLTKPTLKAGYDEVLRLAAMFDIDTERADMWYQDMLTSERYRGFVVLSSDSHDPHIYIKVRLHGTEDEVFIVVGILGLPSSEVQ